MMPKHADVIVTLSGHDGNAFVVIGRCCQAARKAGISDEEIATFLAEATASDYDHLLQTAMRWFEVR